MAEDAEEFDIVIVGGGPAGSVTAYYAAEEGASVAILDRKPRIGVPVRCGEGLPGKVMEDFGIGLNRKWVCNVPGRVRFISPKGKKVEIKPHMDPCVLDRSVFDNMLAKRAVRNGAKLFLERTVVDLKGDTVFAESPSGREAFKGKVIVGADGVDSRIGRWAGIHTRLRTSEIGSCAQYRIRSDRVDPDVMEFSVRKPYLPLGYAWTFPKGGDVANVGVGINPVKRTNAKKVLEGYLKYMYPDAEKMEFTVGCVPSSRPVKNSVKGRVLLVGDAARQVMAATGAGIANAFLAGRIAGEVAAKVARGGKPVEHLSEYDRRWRETFGKRLEKSYKMKERMLRDEHDVERFFLLMKFVLAFYKVMPRFGKERVLANLHY